MSDKKSKAKAPPAKDEPKTAKRGEDDKETGASAAGQKAAAAPAGEAETAAETAEKSGWAAGDIEALRAENAELKDRLLRAHAEMENLRRRTERDKADTAKYAISNFARDVLTIADHIALAIGHVPDDAIAKDDALKSFRDGIMVTERELLNVMERHGITRLEPKGERFDPNSHQAMFEVPNPDVPEGTVVEVVQAGYVIADRVLRPAMVGVSKGGPKPAKAEAASDDQPAPQAANDDNPDAETPPDEPPAGKGGKAGKGIGGKVDKSA